jgi:hypothetical protein
MTPSNWKGECKEFEYEKIPTKIMTAKEQKCRKRKFF